MAASVDRQNKDLVGGRCVFPIRLSCKGLQTAGDNNSASIGFRLQGPAPGRRRPIAWQPTNKTDYHVPEAFRQLVLK